LRTGVFRATDAVIYALGLDGEAAAAGILAKLA
jgi:hypothetical protein